MVEEKIRMSVTVYIPTPFRRFAGNQTYVKAEGQTVMVVPTEVVPEIVKLISKKRSA